jgi:hypothetical protein
VFTSRGVRAPLASWLAAPIGAAIILSVTSLTSAQAADVEVSSCVGGWKNYNCVTRWGPAGDPYVRQVPELVDEAEKQRRETGERKWLARCRPVVTHDRLGVARYRYSAPGCEFGVSEDY